MGWGLQFRSKMHRFITIDVQISPRFRLTLFASSLIYLKPNVIPTHLGTSLNPSPMTGFLSMGTWGLEPQTKKLNGKNRQKIDLKKNNRAKKREIVGG